MAAVARHHAFEDGVGDGDEAFDVGRNHLFPVGEVAGGEGRGAEGEPGVVHQQVDGLPFGRKIGEGGKGRGFVANVKGERQAGVAEFGVQGLQALSAAAGSDDFMAARDEQAGDGSAESGGRAGNEGDHGCSCVGGESGCGRRRVSPSL